MKTESTAAEEHECEYKLIMETQDSNMKRLIADMTRLKEEFASERAGHRAAASALYRAETQLDESREEITKLEDEILDCPADSAYHASRNTGTSKESA